MEHEKTRDDKRVCFEERDSLHLCALKCCDWGSGSGSLVLAGNLL